MLSSIRGLFKGTMGKILVPFLVAVTVLAFAFVGVPELRNFTQRNALEVGDIKYSAQDVREEFSRTIEDYRRQTGEALTNDEAIEAGLLAQTINRLTARSSLRQDAQDLELTATNEMVGEYLRTEPAFANPQTGNFDQQRLAAILTQNRISLAQFRDDIQQQLVIDQLIESLGAPVELPDPWMDYLLKRQSEMREVTYVSLETPAEALDEPTEEQLRGFYDANSQQYMAPEYRVFEAVILRNEDFAEGLERSEEELRQLFEVRRRSLSIPETRTVRQLTYQSEAEAQAAAAQLRDGTPFEALAEQQGLALDRVTFEGVTEDELTDPEIAEALFSTQETGTVVGPIDGLFGYTVGEVLEITPAEETTFEEQRETLEAELIEDETSRRLFDAVEAIERDRDEGASLTEAAEDHPVATVETYGPIDRNLFTADGAVVEDLPVEVLNEAFMLEVGDEIPFVELDNRDGFYAILLDEIRDPELRPFEEVRDQVRTAYLKERRRAATEEKLNTLRATLDEGESSLADAANAVGATATTISISQQQAQNLPQAFVSRLFDARLDNLVVAWGDDDVTAYAGLVRGVSFQPIPQRDQIIALYKQSASQQLGGELIEAYITQLEQDVEVTRNAAEIESAVRFGTQ